ncbi:hypothetical protein NEUTE1DRAFT_102040 [Neurospora tetrasperma FGSC 2508]|uniref:Uncharacterized protein n=1 Tax=Neurospora tetrasperma (strain FGSC 2508 / ATCC MYA-4615 / P0657) TaxID=510951 RepID=F8MQZ3_NEUT8|nr:uncharacterized protein NEUTE1DRAFT_102040 [Neurospora tetrasperma FGSC 2508]EGO56773.1 hypothetical protein NEUTE1DRAFT_102040 [Neurospora tetrasperma FGSC 2508]
MGENTTSEVFGASSSYLALNHAVPTIPTSQLPSSPSIDQPFSVPARVSYPARLQVNSLTNQQETLLSLRLALVRLAVE